MLFTAIVNYHDFDKVMDDTCMVLPKLSAFIMLDEYDAFLGCDNN